MNTLYCVNLMVICDNWAQFFLHYLFFRDRLPSLCNSYLAVLVLYSGGALTYKF